MRHGGMKNFQEKVGFIWSVADLLRGDYKQSDYGKVILPLTVLRRLDCVLEPTKEKLLERAKALPPKADEKMRELMLCQAAGPGMTFYNTSRFVFQPTEAAQGKKYVSLLSDQEQIAANLTNFIAGFSANAREIFLDKFKFGDQINRLDEANLLYLVLSKFTEIDLHPDVVDNIEMGYIFEELIRRFSEASNETAGEHFTPREVIRLMVNLLFFDDSEALTKKGVIRTLYDPAAGTRGMLSVAENYLREFNRNATLKVFGQELNPESYAICMSDMLIKGEDGTNIKFGNCFTQDGLPGETFDYFLSQPAIWRRVEKGRERDPGRAREAGHGGSVRGRLAPSQRWLASLPPAHDFKVPQGRHRLPARHRLQRVAAVHRVGGLRRERNPALDHRERLARSHRRPARPAFLQHRHRHLRLGRHQPQAPEPEGQSPTHRRHQLLREDAKEPGQQAQRDRGRLKRQARPDRRDHQPLR